MGVSLGRPGSAAAAVRCVRTSGIAALATCLIPPPPAKLLADGPEPVTVRERYLTLRYRP